MKHLFFLHSEIFNVCMYIFFSFVKSKVYKLCFFFVKYSLQKMILNALPIISSTHTTQARMKKTEVMLKKNYKVASTEG